MQDDAVRCFWLQGSTSVVVSTIAFGMGIDKADVRYVVHWNASTRWETFNDLPCSWLAVVFLCTQTFAMDFVTCTALKAVL